MVEVGGREDERLEVAGEILVRDESVAEEPLSKRSGASTEVYGAPGEPPTTSVREPLRTEDDEDRSRLGQA